MYFRAFCYLALITLFISAGFAKSEPITFYTENYPPANFYAGDQLKGITIDSLRLMWQEMTEPEPQVMLVPWARGYRNTLSKPNTALFTMSRTPAREPLFKSVHVLMAKKSKNIKISNLGELFNYRVATIRGDISEISLQQIGYPDHNMAKVTELTRAFYMMQSDRVDLMMVSIHGFEHLTRQLKVNADSYESVWIVNEIGNYIAFNIQTPDSVIDKYQKAFSATAKQRDVIKQHYRLSKLEY